MAARPGERAWTPGEICSGGPPAPAVEQPPASPARRLSSHAWARCHCGPGRSSVGPDGALTGFPSPWLAVLQSVTALVTVVMLFVIQHLQARDRTVTQRKLDEILRALPDADNRVIAVEEAPDDELETLTDLNRRDRLG